MVNNFEQIRGMLDFSKPGYFYFLQILQRKKDAKEGMKVRGANNNARLIRAYYIDNMDYFDSIESEVIELCKLFNARAGINLNRRSYERMALQNLRKVTDQIINEDFSKANKSYPSVCGAYSHEPKDSRTWIIDIDHEDLQAGFNGPELSDFIDTLQPIGAGKTVAVIPSKNGYHIIARPFNVVDFKEEYPDINVHKNNPTNLYIP